VDDEQKSEASREEQLGPYQLEEQVPQSNLSQGAFYRATHETSGATALVFKPADEEGTARPRNWRVRLISSDSPGYMALEVEESPWSVAPDKHSVEGLLFLFEGVREGVRRMARAFPDIDEPRPRWRLALAGAAAVCTLLFALVHLAPEFQPPSGPEPLASTPSAPMSHDFNAWLADTTDAGESVLARPLPKEPFKGQKRPPCIRYTEVELVGGCWMQHVLKAPCPNELFEHQGNCYAPTFSAKPPPQSLGQ
jgi:hypothetical protein